MEELLNIVDDNDNIIGTADRIKIHREGLLHREVHVYFMTPKQEIIFQHRARDKDTFPDLLDATVGGHVEINDSYIETAIKETIEETGIRIEEEDLILIDKGKYRYQDAQTGKINNTFRVNYLYIYYDDINDLKIEAGEGLGFEVWPLDQLINLDRKNQAKFIPLVLKFVAQDLKNFIKTGAGIF